MGIFSKAKDTFLGADSKKEDEERKKATPSRLSQQAVPTMARSTQEWLRDGAVQMRAAARKDRASGI